MQCKGTASGFSRLKVDTELVANIYKKESLIKSLTSFLQMIISGVI